VGGAARGSSVDARAGDPGRPRPPSGTDAARRPRRDRRRDSRLAELSGPGTVGDGGRCVILQPRLRAPPTRPAKTVGIGHGHELAHVFFFVPFLSPSFQAAWDTRVACSARHCSFPRVPYRTARPALHRRAHGDRRDGCDEPVADGPRPPTAYARSLLAPGGGRAEPPRAPSNHTEAHLEAHTLEVSYEEDIGKANTRTAASRHGPRRRGRAALLPLGGIAL